MDSPIRQVYLPGVVGRTRRGRVVGLNALAYNAGAAVGPALAGALLPLLGAGWLFLGNSATYLLVAAILVPGPLGRPERGHRGRLTEAVGYAIAAAPVRRLLFLVAAVSLLGRSYVHVLPAVVNETWGADARSYGVAASIPGIGAVIAAGLAAWRLGRPVAARLPATGALLPGGAVIGLGLASSWLAAIGSLLLIVVAATGTMTLLNGGLQLATPDGTRGRVISLYTWLAAGLPALGGWLLGLASSMVGAAIGLASAGIALVILTLLVKPLSPFRPDALGGCEPEHPGSTHS